MQTRQHLGHRQGVSCRTILVCGMIYHTLCLTPEHQMGLRQQSIVGCFSDFPWRWCLCMGLRKQFPNNFVFRTWACAAGLVIILIIIILIIIIILGVLVLRQLSQVSHPLLLGVWVLCQASQVSHPLLLGVWVLCQASQVSYPPLLGVYGPYYQLDVRVLLSLVNI